MGGIGSGRRWGYCSKGRTTDYSSLSISELLRSGSLRPGTTSILSWAPRGNRTRSVLMQAEDNHIILRYTYQGRNDPETYRCSCFISLDWTLCNFGGRRPWFRCPRRGCGRRVSNLYSGAEFACRHCYHLVYDSQSEDISDRLAKRADRIRMRLGWEVGIFNPMGGKPKGMHWETYDRLIAGYCSLVNGSNAELWVKLARAQRRFCAAP